jgi:hypothetical protein
LTTLAPDIVGIENLYADGLWNSCKVHQDIFWAPFGNRVKLLFFFPPASSASNTRTALFW